jgi:hypothetical protein
MRTVATIGALLFVAASAHSQGVKPCEDLKTEIAAKLDAKGVKPYTLEIVAKDKDAEGQSVGTCEGGTKKIMYSRGSAATESAAPKAKKP